jgi:hypothetical protein
MSIAEKLTTIAENEPKVYEAGKKAENDRFWDDVTNKGQRADFSKGFAYWGAEYIRPNRKIIPTANASAAQTFSGCPNLKKIEADYFDFSQKTKGTGWQTGYYYTFYNCPNLEEIEDIGLSPDHSYSTTFSNPKLHTIANITVDKNTQFSGTFDYCYALRHLGIYGTIGQNGFNVRWSPLDSDSVSRIVGALEDKSEDTSGTDWVITLGPANIETAGTGNLQDIVQKGWRYQ